jgi:hypothetical protein
MTTSPFDGGQPSLTDLASAATAEPDPLGRTEILKALKAAIDCQLQECVRLARERGSSWSQIGMALGMTKQAAAQRFGVPAAAKEAPEAATQPPKPSRGRRAASYTLRTRGGTALLRLTRDN